MPACEPSAVNTGTNPTLVSAVPLVVMVGEIIDVGIDWTAWLLTNGGSIRSSAWVAHALSPVAPVFFGLVTAFNETNFRTLAMLDLTAATVNSTYYLTNNVIMKSDPVGSFQMPDRTLSRTIAVKVSK